MSGFTPVIQLTLSVKDLQFQCFLCFLSFAKEWNRVLCADISVYYATKLFHNGVVSDSDRAFGQGN